jgi:hypothetical protein
VRAQRHRPTITSRVTRMACGRAQALLVS